MPVGQGINDPDVVADTTRRVKVFDSRRKQRWVEPQTRTPPTPPRSPTIPEPLLDDLLELLGSGMDETNSKQHDISLHSALDFLDFEEYQSHAEIDEDQHCELEAGTEDEDLLEHLISYVDDSPPPTNPASPREVTDAEMDVAETPFHVSYPTMMVERHEEDDTDMELEEFDRYPKTEPITSEFTSQMFDNFFTNMISTEEDEDDREDTTEDPTAEPSSVLSGFGKGLSDGIEIMKHDCMWAGSCQSETHQDLFEEFFGTVTVKTEYDEDDEYDITSNHESEDPSLAEELDEESSSVEDIRNAVMGDHSYAFNGVGPVQQHQSSQCTQQQSSSTSAQTSHAIHGIVWKEEQTESAAPKKTKILVPLKDLMETLQQKSFFVAPAGPGKKVIRLTGSGETVKRVLDLGAHFKSASASSSSSSSSSSGIFSCSSSSLSLNGGKGHLSSKRPTGSKLKKAIHKPKQELLSPSSPITSSRTSPSSSASSPSSSPSSSHCSSSSNSNSNSNHHSSSSSSSSLSSSNGKPRKAKTHNNMERMRRIDLRNSFDTLRKLVPPLSKANKCSKVEILKSATEYINALKVLDKKMTRERYALTSKNESLRNRLAHLTATSN